MTALPAFTLTGNLNDVLPSVGGSVIPTSVWDRARLIIDDNLTDGVLVWQGKVYDRPPTQVVAADSNGNISVALLANDAGLNVTGIQHHITVESPRGTKVTDFWISALNAGLSLDLAAVAHVPPLPTNPVSAISVNDLIALLTNATSAARTTLDALYVLADVAVSAPGALAAGKNSGVTAAGTYTAPTPAATLTTPPQRFAITNRTTGAVTLSFPNPAGTTVNLTMLAGEVVTMRQVTTSGYVNESGNKGLTQLDARYLHGLKLLYVNDYGADPTGVTDSTAAFNAAKTALGSSAGAIVLGDGTYKIGTSASISTFGLSQGLIGQGSLRSTLNYVGSATCVAAYDPNFTLTSTGGVFGGFSVLGYSAAAGAIGLSTGNLVSIRAHDISVSGFNKTGSIGILFKNGTVDVNWSEQSEWTAIKAILNTDNVIFDTGSFDYSIYEFVIQANANQNGITFRNGAQLIGNRLEVRGNFNTGAGNTGYVWGIDPNGGGSGTSMIWSGQIFFSVECDGSSGLGHVSLKMNGGAGSRLTGSGVINFFNGGSISFQPAVLGTAPQIGFNGVYNEPLAGYMLGGDGLSVQGGSLWSQTGGLTNYASDGMSFYPQFGDYQARLLPNGNITIAGFFGNATNYKSTRKLTIFLKQPASGAAGTVTWPANVKWRNGYNTLSTTNAAVDKITLTYYPSESTWFGELDNNYGTTPTTTAPAAAVTAGDYLPAAVATMPRFFASDLSTTSGQLMLNYFTADKTISVSTMRAAAGAAAAGSTPTLIRFGIYSVAANGDLTLIGSTPTDTTLFGSAYNASAKALSAATTLTLGQRYAFALLIVSSAAMPGVIGTYLVDADHTPRLAGIVNSQSNLPSTITSASVVNVSTSRYIKAY